MSVAHAFVDKAHLLGEPEICQVGIVAGRSHLYQISVSVGVQNFVEAALLVSKHRTPSSPSVLAESLSTPLVVAIHFEAGINVSSNSIVSV